MRHLFWCVVLLGGACEREQPPPGESAISEEMVAEESLENLPEEPVIPEEIIVEEPLELNLSLYLHHVVARASPVAMDVDARLAREGRVEIRERDGWRSASLDDLARRLERSGELRYDEVNGQRVSGIFVGIDVHPKAPWLHLGWLLIVCGECRVYKVQIRVGERTLRLNLPLNSSIHHTGPLPYVHVTVELRGDGYRLGKREVGLDLVVRHLEDAARTAEKPDSLVCVPVIPADVPVDRVMDVLAACLDSRIPRLDLACPIPRKEDRRADVPRRPERGR